MAWAESSWISSRFAIRRGTSVLPDLGGMFRVGGFQYRRSLADTVCFHPDKSEFGGFQLPEASGLNFHMEVFFLGWNDKSLGAVFGPAQVFDRRVEKIAFA